MNILHLQPELNITCGISRIILEITKGKNSGDHYFIATFGGDGFERFLSKGITPLTLEHNKKNIINFPFTLFEIYNICKKYNIHIIHAHHRYFDGIAFLVSKLLTVNTITSVHSFVLKKKLFSYLSNEFIACSEAVGSHLTDYFRINKKKIHVINNFINLTDKKIIEDKGYLLKKHKISYSQFIIGYIGRLDVHEKGIDILISAVKNLSKSKPNVLLLLIGNGRDENTIRDLLVKSTIKWKIIEPQLQIYDYYNLIDIFVLPSRIEPFGIVILEAGLMSKPVIASKVGGIPEIITHEKEGLLFEKGNAIQLSDLLLYMMNNQEKIKILGENLYKKVVDNYTSDKALRLYHDVYEHMMYE